MRERLPETRNGKTLHFVITTRNPEGDGVVDIDGYVQTGEYENGRLGEIFLKVGKEGAATALLDQWAMSASMCLQNGVPVEAVFGKHVNTNFEPFGATNVAGIRQCTSPLDLVSKWILSKYATSQEVTLTLQEERMVNNAFRLQEEVS